MKAVYLLGKGSKWEDNEIKYSIASLRMYLTGISEVVVIGECPDWLQEEVTHVPHPDKHAEKSLNVRLKIEAMCRRETEPFLLMNDDFYFLAPMSAHNFPMYYEGTLEQHINKFKGKNPYKNVLKRTLNFLDNKDMTALNFAVHYPMIIDPRNMALVMKNVPKAVGVSYRCLYGNTFMKSPEYLPDLKLNKPYTSKETEDILRGATMFSIGDDWLTEENKQWLEGKFLLALIT
jgi:hypothetical protein